MRIFNGATPQTGGIAAALVGAGFGLASQTDIAFVPQSKLTLNVNGPNIATSKSTYIYYSFFNGPFIPVYYNGSIVPVKNNTLAQALSDTTKSPAAAVAGAVYDMFIWVDTSGSTPTVRCTRGPAWPSLTSRGTGTGTSELTAAGGYYFNANPITNGPLKQSGIHVGTIYTDAALTNSNVTCSVSFGGAAAGGTPAIVGVWNRYNGAPWTAGVADTAASYAYNTAAWRAANASANMSAAFVLGDVGSALVGTYCGEITMAAGAGRAYIGVGVDSTTTIPAPGLAVSGVGVNTSTTLANTEQATARSILRDAIGLHTMTALEYGSGSATVTSTFYGTGTSGVNQQGLIVEGGYW